MTLTETLPTGGGTVLPLEPPHPDKTAQIKIRNSSEKAGADVSPCLNKSRTITLDVAAVIDLLDRCSKPGAHKNVAQELGAALSGALKDRSLGYD